MWRVNYGFNPLCNPVSGLYAVSKLGYNFRCLCCISYLTWKHAAKLYIVVSADTESTFCHGPLCLKVDTRSQESLRNANRKKQYKKETQCHKSLREEGKAKCITTTFAISYSSRNIFNCSPGETAWLQSLWLSPRLDYSELPRYWETVWFLSPAADGILAWA